MPKADAKNQMLNTVCQKKKKTAENQIIEKCKHDLSSISTHRRSWKTKEKSESVTVPKQFKTPESQNGMFFFFTLIQFIHELAPRSIWLLSFLVFLPRWKTELEWAFYYFYYYYFCFCFVRGFSLKLVICPDAATKDCLSRARLRRHTFTWAESNWI